MPGHIREGIGRRLSGLHDSTGIFCPVATDPQEDLTISEPIRNRHFLPTSQLSWLKTAATTGSPIAKTSRHDSVAKNHAGVRWPSCLLTANWHLRQATCCVRQRIHVTRAASDDVKLVAAGDTRSEFHTRVSIRHRPEQSHQLLQNHRMQERPEDDQLTRL